jgi:ribosomal protein L11 methylase PrmA
LGKHPALDLRYAPGPGAGTLQDFLYAELDPFGPIAIQEHETGDGWRVFFRTAADRDAARGALASEFHNALLALSPVNVDDEDWARRSQQALKAVRVGRVVVAPPWDVPASAPASPPRFGAAGPASAPATSPRFGAAGPAPAPSPRSKDVVVVIEPSMGFGTGHHQSTRLCLALLQNRDVGARTAIDVGTGSGVLAIAAAKLGAVHVRAIDNDADAIENARDNIARNGVASQVEAHVADLGTETLAAADIVIANLTGALLARHAGQLAHLVRPSGILIAAGLLADEQEMVAGVFAPGLTLTETAEEDEWRGLVLTRSAEPDLGRTADL